MTITNERNYLKNLDACVYISGGEFIFHSAAGYKTFKTLAGLNKHIAKIAKMCGREADTVTL